MRSWASSTPPPNIRIALRDRLRVARHAAQNDAENYGALLIALEQVGAVLSGQLGTLESYRPALLFQIERSGVARAWPDLFSIVQRGRNDALHHGAVARHLADNCVALSIGCESGLMKDDDSIEAFMVGNPTVAEMWQPLWLIRQTMLTNGFSYLPVETHRGDQHEWRLLSDTSLAHYLRKSPHEAKNETLGEACRKGMSLLTTVCVSKDQTVRTTIHDGFSKPMLVTHKNSLIGIITAFDLL